MEDRDSGLLTLPDELGVAFDSVAPGGVMASGGVLVLRGSSDWERDILVYIIHRSTWNIASQHDIQLASCIVDQNY